MDDGNESTIATVVTGNATKKKVKSALLTLMEGGDGITRVKRSTTSNGSNGSNGR